MRRALAPDVRRHAADAAALLAQPVGGSLARTDAGKMVAAVRRTQRRALWPFLSEQRAIQSALVEALIACREALVELEARTAAIERRLAQAEHAGEDAQPEHVGIVTTEDAGG